MLKFSPANTKLKHLKPHLVTIFDEVFNRKVTNPVISSFSKLSGHTCPFARDCLSKVVIKDGKRKVEDGPVTEFRCFSASQEAVYTPVYNQRKHNTDLIKGKNRRDIYSLIKSSLPKFDCMRIHIGGDFSTRGEFQAWNDVARDYPDRIFYAYTKSLPFWVDEDISPNFILTASRGGHKDNLIEEYQLREAVVVGNEDEANQLGLKVDHNDSLAADPRESSFALLIHSIQPAGSKYAQDVINNRGHYKV